MYEFRPVTERAWAFREKVRERRFRVDSERSMIVTRFYAEHENLIPVLRIPMALKEVCEKMTIRVEDGELLVANRKSFAKKYPGLTVDRVSLEDIMLFVGKGEAQ